MKLDIKSSTFVHTPQISRAAYKALGFSVRIDHNSSILNLLGLRSDSAEVKSLAVLISSPASVKLTVLPNFGLASEDGSQLWYLRVLHNGDSEKVSDYVSRIDFSRESKDLHHSIFIDTANNVVMTFNKGIARRLLQASTFYQPELIHKNVLSKEDLYRVIRCPVCDSVYDLEKPLQPLDTFKCNNCTSVLTQTYNGVLINV